MSGPRLLKIELALKGKTAILVTATIALLGTKHATLWTIGLMRPRIFQPGCPPLTNVFGQLKHWSADLPFAIIRLLSLLTSMSPGLKGDIYSILECHIPMDP